MVSISHLTQKLLQERARNSGGAQQPMLPEIGPPPYSEVDSDSDDSDDDDEPDPSPMKFTINAAHSIHGSNNLVPTSLTPLADATKFSTLLLHAVNQMNNANANANAAGLVRARRALKMDLTINCGITVVGDRNVIGNVGLRPKIPGGVGAGAASAGNAAVAGAKRNAEEVSYSDGEPALKKVATGENRE